MSACNRCPVVTCAKFDSGRDRAVTASTDGKIRQWDVSHSVVMGRVRDSALLNCPMSDVARVHVLLDSTKNFPKYLDHIIGPKLTLSGPFSIHPNSDNPQWLVGPYKKEHHIGVWKDKSKLPLLVGHYDSVTCAIFHPTTDLILSCSLDKSIRVWGPATEGSTREYVLKKVYHRYHERFWTLAVHPTLNLLAAGHDGGLLVFKLWRERPAYEFQDKKLFYIKDNKLLQYDFTKKSSRGRKIDTMKADSKYRLSLNASRNNLIVNRRSGDKMDKYTYTLYHHLPNGRYTHSDDISSNVWQSAAVWVSPKRYAGLTKEKQLMIIDTSNMRQYKVNIPSSEDLFSNGHNHSILLKDKEGVTLFDVKLWYYFIR